MKTTHRASNATITITAVAGGFITLQRMYLLVFIHLEDTISVSPSRYVKSLLPSPLSVPSPFDGRNERHYPRKFRSLPDKMSLMSGRTWQPGPQCIGECVCFSLHYELYYHRLYMHVVINIIFISHFTVQIVMTSY